MFHQWLICFKIHAERIYKGHTEQGYNGYNLNIITATGYTIAKFSHLKLCLAEAIYSFQ